MKRDDSQDTGVTRKTTRKPRPRFAALYDPVKFSCLIVVVPCENNNPGITYVYGTILLAETRDKHGAVVLSRVRLKIITRDRLATAIRPRDLISLPRMLRDILSDDPSDKIACV